MSPIEKVLNIAKQEIGYLEKANKNNLYHKTANAGSKNFTKYWAEVYPEFQGEPWCACFVTWVLDQAFGKSTTKELLKHYPFVYCQVHNAVIRPIRSPFWLLHCKNRQYIYPAPFAGKNGRDRNAENHTINAVLPLSFLFEAALPMEQAVCYALIAFQFLQISRIDLSQQFRLFPCF